MAPTEKTKYLMQPTSPSGQTPVATLTALSTSDSKRMSRKRKRSAYTALSSAQVLRYQPHHTSRTQTATTLHVTPAPPESITEFESSQPSPRTPTSTPLVVRASDIASVQLALGFTPGTPANSLVYLGVDEQQHAKALIDSPHHVQPRTPRVPRRLSLGSTVTPIPLKLESPDKIQSAHSTPIKTPVCLPQPPQLHSSQQPLPSPITPQQQIHPPSQPLSPDSHCHTGGLLDSPPLLADKAPLQSASTLNTGLLFTTASGKPLPAPKPARKANVQSELHPAPLFTTGKGKPLAPVNTKSLARASTLLNTTSSASNPHNNLVRTLFSTGKRKPVHTSKSVIPPASAFRAPLTDKTNVSSLFTTGSGKRVCVPPCTNQSLSFLHRPHPSPGTPSIHENALRKTLFTDSASPSNTKGPSSTGMTLRNSIGKSLGRSHQSRSTRKTTPFRRPRKVIQIKEDVGAAKPALGNPFIPRWEVPPLSRTGSIFCNSPLHMHHRLESKHDPSEGFVPVFSLAPNCLESCLRFVFSKDSFGSYSCLPEDIVQHFQFKDLASFSVGNVLSWTRALFPAAVHKPASCFGSAAWTRMSYSLAVWKLVRLNGSFDTQVKLVSFLSAANVMRELVRRIEIEWHSNRQPHLLRIMRKDSSSAGHIVLILSGLEVLDGNMFVLVSDGWYLTRAVVDEIVEKRIWSGKLRIGDKIRVVGASLEGNEQSRPFFFGEGDELGTSVLRLFPNGVRKTSNALLRLGAHPSAWSGSLRWVADDGGRCPMLRVVILRSYPVFYMEALSSMGAEDNGERQFKYRRAEGEDQARARHQDNVREKLQADGDSRKEKMSNTVEPQQTEQRDVRTVKEVMICGTKDDPAAPSARKLLRVYNVPGTLQASMSNEGDILFLSQVIPKKSGWTCKPDRVQHVPRQKRTEPLASDALLKFPRKLYSVPQLRNGAVMHNDDFDGVFLLLYVTSDCSNRFAYLTSAPADSINILALQLSDADSECLPRALQLRKGRNLQFPIIGIKDAKYCYRDSNLDILHANTTMRTSFLTSRSLSRMHCSSPLRLAYGDLESRVQGKEPQLEVLREAVISFTSGTRSSVSAYFTSTQDM